MNKRQAKIEALNCAIDLIKNEIDNPTDLTIEYEADQPTVHACLEAIVRDLEDKRDDAAYRQYKVDERKAARAEWLENIKKRSQERWDAKKR